MARDTRERIITAAATLFRRQGYTGTGLQQIAAESQTGVGSIYHFFSGGKDALTAEVVRTGGAAYGVTVDRILANGPKDPVDALRAMFEQAAVDLAATDYADACPIATIALEVASTNEPLRIATAEVFDSWIQGLTAFCHQIIDDPAGARDLAVAVLVTLEGAFILARAARDPEPLLAAGRSVERLATAVRTRSADTKPAPVQLLS